MNFFRRWFQGSQYESIVELEVNSSTHVIAQDLIKLQQHANKIDLSRNAYASASNTGVHRSNFRGRGMDYQESRIYQAGDDIRNMDWRVTARAGKPHTKLYQEERERPVVLLVDLNPGMFFGSTNSLKSVLAAKVASLIAWSAAAKGDRIGGLIINHSHHELPPKTGKRGVLQLIRELVQHGDPNQVMAELNEYVSEDLATDQRKKQSSLNEELRRLRRLAKPGSLVFLISDFYAVNEDTANQLQSLSQHNDIQAIQIVDPLELEPPPPDRYAVTNGKQSGILNAQSKKGREQYQRYFQKHHQNLLELMRNHGIPLIQLSTKDDVLLEFQRHFGRRKKQPKAIKAEVA